MVVPSTPAYLEWKVNKINPNALVTKTILEGGFEMTPENYALHWGFLLNQYYLTF